MSEPASRIAPVLAVLRARIEQLRAWERDEPVRAWAMRVHLTALQLARARVAALGAPLVAQSAGRVLVVSLGHEDVIGVTADELEADALDPDIYGAGDRDLLARDAVRIRLVVPVIMTNNATGGRPMVSVQDVIAVQVEGWPPRVTREAVVDKITADMMGEAANRRPDYRTVRHPPPPLRRPTIGEMLAAGEAADAEMRERESGA